MAFGFDPSLILSGRHYTGPDANESLRTLADLAGRRVQRQQAEVQLADMMRKQGQERTLASILQQHANNPDAVAPALMRSGLGSAAMDWMGNQSELEQRRAAAKNAMAKALQERAELLSRPLRGGLKTQADLERAHAAWRAAGLGDAELAGIPTAFNEQTAPLFERIAAMGLSAQDVERERHNREMETRPPSTMPVIVMGDGGAQYFVDPRKPSAPAVPVTDASGNQLKKTGSESKLPPTVIADLAAFDVAEKQVDDIFAKFESSGLDGLSGRANQAATDFLGLRDTRSAEYEGSSKAARQGVGTILEGGKLAAGDEVKYKKMFPEPGDSKAVRENKKVQLKSYLRELKNAKLKALDSSGYQVPTSLSGGKAAAPASGPHGPTVIQGGHTYTWNAKTGEYE